MIRTRTKTILCLSAALLAPVSAVHAQDMVLLGEPASGSSSAAPAAAAAPAAGARASLSERAAELSGPLRLEVRVGERQLYVYKGETVLETFPVAVGKSAHPTPKGEFDIRRLIWNPRWVPPEAKWARGKTAKAPGDPNNPMGRVKMFFLPPDYYIHGTNAEESLGSAASHGCVRMANEDIVELARVVMEHGGEAREPGWFQRVLNRVRSSQEVRLSAPVPVSIRS